METPLHRQTRRVVFGDVDMAGWMHFPRVFAYFEEAEHEWLRLQGLPIIDAEEGGWPRARVECDYKIPLRFGDEIEVRLGVERVGSSSVTWLFEIWKGDLRAANGRVVNVRVDPSGRPLLLDATTRAKLGAGAG